MFCSVVMRGCWPVLMAYCSAGRPKASQPIGCSTLKPQRAAVAGEDVRGGVAFRMADVQPGAARVGEHVEDVELGQLLAAAACQPWRWAKGWLGGNGLARVPRAESLLLRPSAAATWARSDETDTVCAARHKAANIGETTPPEAISYLEREGRASAAYRLGVGAQDFVPSSVLLPPSGESG